MVRPAVRRGSLSPEVVNWVQNPRIGSHLREQGLPAQRRGTGIQGMGP